LVNRSGVKNIFIAVFTLIIFFPGPAFADGDIQVHTVLEKNEVFVGESFLYQIQIKGSDQVEGFPEGNWRSRGISSDFSADFLGGSTNSSTMISTVNGKTTRTVNLTHVLSYRLTPLRPGDLVIPGFSLKVEGEVYTTRPLIIQAKEPEESEDFILRISLPQKRAYVGEPLEMKFVWYIGYDVKSFTFSIPFLKTNDFAVIDPEPPLTRTSDYVRLPVQDSEVLAKRGRGRMYNKEYTTFTFTKIIIPKTSGNFYIPKAVISLEAQTGVTRSDDPFDSFFFGDSPEYQHYVIPSNSLNLRVLPLPPNNNIGEINGRIGHFRIETSADPLSVYVGDPITLTITLHGSFLTADTVPPDLLQNQELGKNFRIPSEMSAGKKEGDAVVFTQSIRPENASVSRIPPLELPYFDTDTGTYRTAQSEAISIVVEEAQGIAVESFQGPSGGPSVKKIVEQREEGIAFNYETIDALENQVYGWQDIIRSPFLFLILVPPLFFLVNLAVKFLRSGKNADSARLRRRAFTDFEKRCRSIENEKYFSNQDFLSESVKAFQEYCRNRFGKNLGTIALVDMQNLIREKGGREENYPALISALEILDRLKYAGSRAERESCLEFIRKLRAGVQELEAGGLK